MKTALRFTLIMAMLFMAAIAYGLDVPFLTGRVTDNAEILTADTRRAVTKSLKAHEERTGNQIAVLTVPALEGESIEEYAVAVFNAWKLGKKGQDNGLLVIIATNDRRMRIEVGYGLEGVMPDAAAGRIIRNVMAPRFKTGDYNDGVVDGVKAIIDVLEGGNAPDMARNGGDAAQKSSVLEMDGPDLSITERILLGAFIFGIIGLFTFIGILTPGAGWFLYFFLIPFWAMFPVVVLGATGALYCLITYVIGFPVAKLLLKNTDWYTKARSDLRTKGEASIGGFMISSGGSGSSSNSGFSGGGGSSGGGGASGSW
jgi:uncharacterized protein